NNCEDSGPGSLRAAIFAADDTDTVDLTQLSCSTITLTGGEIVISQTNITLDGPGKDKLTINDDYNSRVFLQTSFPGFFPHLQINDLSIRNGRYYNSPSSSAYGGCIAVPYYLTLTNTNVANCYAGTYSAKARGGAIFARYVTLVGSTVSGSTANCY